MSKKIFHQKAIKGMQEFSEYIAIVVRNTTVSFLGKPTTLIQPKDLIFHKIAENSNS